MSSGKRRAGAILEGAAPVEVQLTAGAVKNGYLRVPTSLREQSGSPASGEDRVLCLDGMGEVDGAIDAKKGVFRWRGWRKFYQHHGLKAGDVVAIVPLDDRRYRVSPQHNSLIDVHPADDDLAAADSDAPSKRKPVPRNKRCNELDGGTWLQLSLSVWSEVRKSAEEQKLGHPAMFPASLVDRLIRAYMRPDDRVVLDPFMGSGSTLVAARNAGKHGIGIEIYPQFIKLASQRLAHPILNSEAGSAEILEGDARRILATIKPDSVDLCVTSPPYWNILNQRRTADSKEIRTYGDAVDDLGNIDCYEEFIRALGDVFDGVYRVLRPGAYCCVNVMDLRKQDRFYPYHADLAGELESRGFIFDDLIIWNRGQEYNNLRPLGYPYTFRINKIHEYILILQKPGKRRDVD